MFISLAKPELHHHCEQHVQRRCPLVMCVRRMPAFSPCKILHQHNTVLCMDRPRSVGGLLGSLKLLRHLVGQRTLFLVFPFLFLSPLCFPSPPLVSFSPFLFLFLWAPFGFLFPLSFPFPVPPFLFLLLFLFPLSFPFPFPSSPYFPFPFVAFFPLFPLCSFVCACSQAARVCSAGADTQRRR